MFLGLIVLFLKEIKMKLKNNLTFLTLSVKRQAIPHDVLIMYI